MKIPLPAALLVVLLGCSETELQRVPPPTLDADVTPAAPETAPTPTRWDELDGADIPDDLMVLAWEDEGEPRVDVVDVLGRVVLSVDRPAPPTPGFRPTAVSTAGAFALVSEVGGAMEDTDATWRRTVWRADLMAEESALVLLAGEDRIELPTRDEAVLLDAPAQQVLAVLDPDDPDLLWAVSWRPDAALDGTVVHRLPLTDGPIESTALAAFVDDAASRLLLLREVLFVDGHLALLGRFADADGEASDRLLVLDPAGARLEPAPGWPRVDAAVAPAGDLVQLARLRPPAPSSPTSCSEVLETWQDGVATELTLPGVCAAPGPLLDAAGPTFVVAGRDALDLDAPERLLFVHRGELVWAIDAVAVGLGDRPLRFVDAAAL